MNAERYREMISSLFLSKMQELEFHDMCHTARVTMDLLEDEFGEHFSSPSEAVNWPPRSCDLTPLDYFLWGYVNTAIQSVVV